ncbi:MAG: metallophosphatase domain-containing protein [Myxococcales bacterium]|nr:metallophosphatase domain-containing protein [Myxococcales bacterium]
MPRVVCLSDTHGRHAELAVPEGDVLLLAGDVTRRGRPDELAELDAWLATLPHPHKVLIAGNHDFLFETDPPRARSLIRHATYLEDEEVTVCGLRIWGSPWQPAFFDWAFNLPRGEALRRVWEAIPAGLDVLLTHTPPRGVLDRTSRGQDVGCDDLLAAVARARPRLHVFGHIHEDVGRVERDGTIFVNACSCTLSYVPSNPPIVIDL